MNLKKFFWFLILAGIVVGAIAESRAYDEHADKANKDREIRALRMVTVISTTNATAQVQLLDGSIESVSQDYHNPLHVGGVYNLTLRRMRDGSSYASKLRLNYVEEEFKLCATDVLDYDPRIAKVCYQ